MTAPSLTSFAAPEGRVSAFGRPGGTEMNFQQLRSVREAVRQGFNLTEVAVALSEKLAIADSGTICSLRPRTKIAAMS